jgi:putative transposase
MPNGPARSNSGSQMSRIISTVQRPSTSGFKALWRWRSRRHPASRVAAETAALIRSVASANRLWGAERIRGELLKLGVKVSKRTIQKHMRAARPARPRGQRWSTFLRSHAQEIWACDFLQAYDVFFRSIFAFVFIELATRKVALAATTRFPSQAWVTQQLRNATPSGATPRFLIRDPDDKFGTAFDALARATGIRMVRTAVRAPNMNAVCERFLGSLRREASTTFSCSTAGTSSASSPSTSATTTPRALTKGSSS